MNLNKEFWAYGDFVLLTSNGGIIPCKTREEAVEMLQEMRGAFQSDEVGYFFKLSDCVLEI